MVEIFAEVVTENHIVAPTASILDDNGRVVKKFTDGLPARVNVLLPANSKSFTVDVAGRQITQDISHLMSA